MKRAFLAALGLATGFAMPATAQDIKVGLLLPFSGVYAALGNDIEVGFTTALEQFGSETAATFEIVREDTEVKPPVALAKAKKLILQDKVDVISGIVSSGVLGAVRDMVHGAGVPLIVANAGNDEATGEACSPYITRMSFSNGQVNRPMGQWMYDQGIRKVYTLAPDYAAGRQMIDGFVQTFTAAGGEIVGQDFTPFQKTQDFGPYMAQAKSSGAEAVFVFYAGGEAISFVKQYDSFGLKAELPLYGSGFLTSSLYVNAQGPAAEGVITALHYVPTIDSPANAQFVEAFTAKTGRVPSEFAVHGYDAGRALIEAVKAGATDRESLANALRQVRFDGPRGALSIDPATNNIVQPIYVYETIAGTDGLTQKVLAELPAEADPVNGCEMAAPVSN
ncbi:Twin-arginine translocation pathway signal [Roseovarius sp. TM1035]|jgi:branched-chain amino acid transport system substrate-binding protein|uniref:ABC transporter substrate-binding protein n=1 Tax=Roseovarius TaxID=74030 RepID=UPI00015575F1|nr:ABC transporter substrate-binding protein [Roseovarius sp. TM1035]AWZ21282.1 Benzoate transport, extracellular ligand-binding receptor [Roseovarius sp. AK1035]EDM30773.1 Twin-arginine translocation pathway signal [Roseovarius sp. TM1035]